MMLAMSMLLFFFSLRTIGSAEAGLRTSWTVSDGMKNNQRNMPRMLTENTQDNFIGGLSERLLEKLKDMVEERKEGEKPLVMLQSSLYKLWVEGTNIRKQTEKRDKVESGWRSPKVPRKNSYFSK